MQRNWKYSFELMLTEFHTRFHKKDVNMFKKYRQRVVNIPTVSYFFVIRFVSITYWKS